MSNHVNNARETRGKPFLQGNPGRPKGTPNKFTHLKEAFLEAFEETGGKEALKAWAMKHQTEFYTIIARMLPKEIELSAEVDVNMGVVVYLPQRKGMEPSGSGP